MEVIHGHLEEVVTGEDLYSYPNLCTTQGRVRDRDRIILKLGHHIGTCTLDSCPDRARDWFGRVVNVECNVLRLSFSRGVELGIVIDEVQIPVSHPPGYGILRDRRVVGDHHVLIDHVLARTTVRAYEDMIPRAAGGVIHRDR